MRPLRVVARVLGWLLTPLVAWAASFLGAWVGALVAAVVPNATAGLVLTVLGAALFALAATLAWMRLLRRSPDLREALDLTEEGLPTPVAELGGKEEP